MNHSDLQTHMADYLEGDLDLHRRALFDAHLDQCEDCARELSEMRSTIGLVRAMPDPEVPWDLADNVMRRIRTGEGEPTLLDRFREGLAAFFAPRVLFPLSTALVVMGLLQASGQVRFVLPIQLVDPEPQPIARVRPLAGPGAGSPELAIAQAPTQGGGVGASAAQEAGYADARELADALAATEARRRSTLPSVTLHAGDTGLGRVHPLDLDALLGSFGANRPPLAPAPNVLTVADTARNGDATSGMGPLYRFRAPTPAPATSSGVDELVPTTDEWLELVRQSPDSFANRLARLTLAEQELWVDNLARRAMEQGNISEVIAALRSGNQGRARLLAEDFEAARIAHSE